MEGGDDALGSNDALRRYALVPAHRAQLHLPFDVAGYANFSALRQHAFSVGTEFRWAEGGSYRVGSGECVGRILPAPAERRW
jgi:hypothetical protein